MAVKKKLWNVEIPLLNSNIELSAFELNQLDKKTIKIDLTRMLHGKNMEATFLISIKDNKASANLKKMALFPFYIQRAIRKGISYVEGSFPCVCGEYNLRIKPFLITRKEVHRSVRNALRTKAHELIKEYCEKNQPDDVFSSILSGKMQKDLSLKLKKIYPLAFCEIRALEVKKKK
jgi:ribosomal protein S3AE